MTEKTDGKKIAILFTGQIRQNGLSNNVSSNKISKILDGYNNYLVNENFKKSYDYDIFISADSIDINKTLNFFGADKVKNIHLSNENKYLHQIDSEIKSENEYLNRYMNMIPNEFVKYPNHLLQFLRVFDCYELLKRYTDINNYDYVIRSRLDVVYLIDVNTYINELEQNKELLFIGYDDQFGIGRPNIMDAYLSSVNELGTFHNLHLRNNFTDALTSMETWKLLLNSNKYKNAWRYASTQIHESLYNFCDKNNLSIDKSIKRCDVAGYYIYKDDMC